jgi:hypothetical protein
MKSAEKLYDLFVYDCDLEGEEREDAKTKLAKILKIKAEQVESLFNGKGTAVGKAVPLEIAQKFHQTLLALHIRCNYRPSNAATVDLELAPLKPEKIVTCPACACIHRYPEDEPAPSICEKCGLVFAKYERVEQVKEERDKIKRTLLAQHQRLLDAEREEREQKEKALRRAELEQQIRKELGLPKFAASRSGLISTGMAIFLLGLGLGGGGVVAVQTWTQPEESKLAATAGKPPGIPQAALSQADFELQIQQLQAQEAQAATPTDSRAAPAPLPGEAMMPQATGAAGNMQALSPLLQEMLAEFNQNAEWDGLRLARAKAAFDQGVLAEAMQELAGVSLAKRRAEQGADWADWLMRQNYAPQAEKLYAYLGRSLEKPATGGIETIEALMLLARRQTAAGFAGQAASALKAAARLAAGDASACGKASAAAIASVQASPAQAPSDFHKAQAGLAAIGEPALRDTCKASLARIYAQAGGARFAANSLLQDSLGSMAGMEAAARLYAEWGETASALALARKLPEGYSQERLLYRLLADGFAAGRAEGAAEILSFLRLPAWRARVQGLLAAARKPGMLENARATAETIADPAEKAALMSELARIAAQLSDSGNAEALFRQASSMASGLAPSPSRNAVAAILARNQALAQSLSSANLLGQR